MQTQNFEPMSIGRIVDQSFRFYRENFLRFITIAAIIMVPIFLVQLVGVSIFGHNVSSERPAMIDPTSERTKFLGERDDRYLAAVYLMSPDQEMPLVESGKKQ